MVKILTQFLEKPSCNLTPVQNHSKQWVTHGCKLSGRIEDGVIGLPVRKFGMVQQTFGNRILTVFRAYLMLGHAVTRSDELRDKKWDERFMLLAHHLAHWSIEKGRRVGAVVVGPDNEIRSTGYNGLPRGVNDAVGERHSRITGAKYIWSCHAEQNAIFNAARIGIALKGCAIYVPWFPGVECTKAIIQSGISEVVGYEPDQPNSDWAQDFAIASTVLKEANVVVRFIPRLAELPDVSEENG
jgi:dCMP deaminase